jgi:hypothetical protein
MGTCAQNLHIHGHVRDSESRNALNAVRVVVEVEGNNVVTHKCDASGKYDFFLPLGEDYRIIYQRKRYFRKVVRMDTRNIPNSAAVGGFELKLDGTLKAKEKKVDPAIFEIPVAIASYSESEGSFMFDFPYTEKRLAEIEKAMSEAKKRRGSGKRKRSR